MQINYLPFIMGSQLTSHFTIPGLARLICWLLLTVGGGLLASCSQPPQMSTAEAGLVGHWEWTQTTTAQQNTLTPTTTGHRMSIRFDRQNRARFYQDDALVSAAKFTVRRDGLHWWGGPVRHTIIYQGYRRRQVFSLTTAGLQLEDVASQPATHRFQRTSPPIATSSVQLKR